MAFSDFLTFGASLISPALGGAVKSYVNARTKRKNLEKAEAENNLLIQEQEKNAEEYYKEQQRRRKKRIDEMRESLFSNYSTKRREFLNDSKNN